MKVRVILVCTLLLLAAVPSFALPVCAECNFETNECEELPGSITRCKYNFTTGACFTTFERCSTPFAATTVLTELKVASIEISRPATECVTGAAPAAVTIATPTPQPAELK
jgi:hypothetical protein